MNFKAWLKFQESKVKDKSRRLSLAKKIRTTDRVSGASRVYTEKKL